MTLTLGGCALGGMPAAIDSCESSAFCDSGSRVLGFADLFLPRIECPSDQPRCAPWFDLPPAGGKWMNVGTRALRLPACAAALRPVNWKNLLKGGVLSWASLEPPPPPWEECEGAMVPRGPFCSREDAVAGWEGAAGGQTLAMRSSWRCAGLGVGGIKIWQVQPGQAGGRGQVVACPSV